MTKTTYCPECSGRGYIQRSEVIDNGDGTGSGRVWTENCGECNGTGIKEVPMTNYDRISVMSLEEVAELLTVRVDGFQPCPVWLSLPTENAYISKLMAVHDTRQWLIQEADSDDP